MKLQRRGRGAVGPWLGLLLPAFLCLAPAVAQDDYQLRITDEETEPLIQEGASWPEDAPLPSEDDVFREATFQEPALRVVPRGAPAPTPRPAEAGALEEDLFSGELPLSRSLLSGERFGRAAGVTADAFRRGEAVSRNTTDAGALLGQSPSALGLGVQRRNPIVNDPRIRGSRIGSLAASGSYWVPARMDLDSTLSKIDSQILSDVVTIKGPYAVQYGPGFSFIDFELQPTPRCEEALGIGGSTGFDYRGNGQQWSGRQTLWGGAADWGFRAGYGHRTGNDYTAGNGQFVAASYHSRDLEVALGRDFDAGRHVEFRYLRLDQTGVELPGQAFDIDWLCTDGYELSYAAEEQLSADRLTLDAWYNRTRLDGNAQNASKRAQFPYYDFIKFKGFTDVDSMSAGFRLAASWEGEPDERLTVGVDLRCVEQELNEITSGRVGFEIWRDANSPVPRSAIVDPGLFVEWGVVPGEDWSVTAGARFGIAGADVLADLAQLASLGTRSAPYSPISLADIVGSGDFSQTYAMGAAYLAARHEINPCWTAELAVGYAERPPTLTELYAAETFMFVLQNGLNTVTGDPLLKREKLLQVDAGLSFQTGPVRGRVGVFCAWAWDYVTFENLGVVRGPPYGEVEQVQLKFVNTDLATFAGAEGILQWECRTWLTPFATLSYVEGTDQTRTGDFATRRAEPGSPSERISGFSRGAFSGISGDAEEPLPSIVPLEGRFGLRFHEPAEVPRWSVELAARAVAAQRRIAASLLEVPSAGFTVWDLRGYWRIKEHLLALGGIENFTDKNYREHLNFTSQNGLIQVFQPGLNAYVGARLEY